MSQMKRALLLDICLLPFLIYMHMGGWLREGSIDCYLIIIAIMLACFIIFSFCKEPTADYRKQNEILNLIKIGSCLGVLGVHIMNHIPLHGVYYDSLSYGSYGVNSFFLISGFSICASLESKKNSLKQYYIKRFFRIVPIYYSVIALVYVFCQLVNYPIQQDEYNLGWMRYIFFLSTSFYSKENFWVNLCATWSIPVFVVFYILAPFLVYFMNDFKKSFLGMVLGYVICEEIFPIMMDQFEPIIGIDAVIMYKNSFPLRFLWIFLVGINCYYALKYEFKELTVALYAIIFFFYCIWKCSNNVRIFVFIFILTTSLLILVNKNIRINSERISSGINIFSEYTYAIYLVHPMIIFFSQVFRPFFSNTIVYVLFLFYLITVISYTMHKLIELPAQKMCGAICRKSK